jgi:hypothetical protein
MNRINKNARADKIPPRKSLNEFVILLSRYLHASLLGYRFLSHRRLDSFRNQNWRMMTVALVHFDNVADEISSA